MEKISWQAMTLLIGAVVVYLVCLFIALGKRGKWVKRDGE